MIGPNDLIVATHEQPCETGLSLYFKKTKTEDQAAALKFFLEDQGFQLTSLPEIDAGDQGDVLQRAMKISNAPEEFLDVHLLAVSPPLTRDVIVLQLIVSMAGAPLDSWRKAGIWLSGTVLTAWPLLGKADFLGYAVIYHAGIAATAVETGKLSPELMDAVSRPFGKGGWRPPPHPIIEPVGDHGWLLSLHIPTPADNCTAYLALSKKNEGTLFSWQAFAGLNAFLVPFDAFLLRGISQFGVIAKGFDEAILPAVRDIRAETTKLFKAGGEHDPEVFRKLAPRAMHFSQALYEVRLAEMTIEQQLGGIKRLFIFRYTGGGFAGFYTSLLSEYLSEASAISRKLDNEVQAVQLAVSFVETEVSKSFAADLGNKTLLLAFIAIYVTAFPILSETLRNAKGPDTPDFWFWKPGTGVSLFAKEIVYSAVFSCIIVLLAFAVYSITRKIAKALKRN